MSYEVVICTYNGARFLPAQLESLTNQSLPPTKISVYDDGSTDQTVDIAENVLKKAREHWNGNFRIQSNPHNIGYAANFQQGLEHATENYVLLSDQDDTWTPDKAVTLLALLRSSGVDLVFSDGIPIDEQDQPIGGRTVLASYGLGPRAIDRFNDSPFDALVRRNCVNGAAMAIRRDAATNALPVPEGIPHDYWLALWAAAHGGILCSPACLYGYRQHGDNLIGLSAGGPLDMLRSAWRYPIAPRQRELHIWSLIASRIDDQWSSATAQATHRKLEWIKSRFALNDSKPRLFIWIVSSVLTGRYATLSIGRSILRDIAALFHRDPVKR